MSEYTAHPTQPGNTHELTSPGTLNYDITRSGSTRRWGTEPQMKSSGNGSNNTEQRRNPKIPCPEISGLLSTSGRGLGGFSGVDGASLSCDEAGVAGSGWFEQPDVLVVGLVRGEKSCAVPRLDGRGVHGEQSGDLVFVEQASGAETLGVAG